MYKDHASSQKTLTNDFVTRRWFPNVLDYICKLSKDLKCCRSEYYVHRTSHEFVSSSFPKVKLFELKFTQQTKNKLRSLHMFEKIEKNAYTMASVLLWNIWGKKVFLYSGVGTQKFPYPHSTKPCHKLHILRPYWHDRKSGRSDIGSRGKLVDSEGAKRNFVGPT